MKQHTQAKDSLHDKQLRRIELYSALPAIVLLSIALALGSVNTDGGHVNAADIIWSVVSLLGLIGLTWSGIISYRRADELQKRIRLQAAAFGFMFVIIGLFAGQLLQALDLVSIVISSQVTFIGGVLFWNFMLTILSIKKP